MPKRDGDSIIISSPLQNRESGSKTRKRRKEKRGGGVGNECPRAVNTQRLHVPQKREEVAELPEISNAA